MPQCASSHAMLIKHTRPLKNNHSYYYPLSTLASIGSENQQKISLTNLLKRCNSPKNLKSIHATMIKNNAHQDSFHMNQFITACSRFHLMHHASLACNQMVHRNVFVYNAMIAGYVRCSMPSSALQLFVEMIRCGAILPTEYTYSSVVKACTLLLARSIGEAVHCRAWNSGFGNQMFLQTGLIKFYSSIGRIVESRRVFDEMPARDCFAWTTMLCGYARASDLDEARKLFEEMAERNTASWNVMIGGYARTGDVASAALLFDRLPSKDLISWTTMISSYSHNKCFKEAVEIFQAMRATGVKPDAVTLATVISACAHLGALDMGKELHHYAMLNGFELDVYLGSALIDMYAKCGSIERSLLSFYKLKEKNLFCWNSLIEGLAIHGLGSHALNMFDRMTTSDVVPNGVSFVSVLSACTHAGLVEQGRRLFTSMVEEYLIAPDIEHYGCMVDLLARAGLLQKALEMIESMAMEPNSAIWGALLSGCKLHYDLEIGKLAVERLMCLEPDNSGYYMLLVNMHAEGRRWAEVAAVRGMMKSNGAQKTSPGRSCIELEGAVHEFGACDMSHPLAHEISSLIVELDGQLKLAVFAFVEEIFHDSND